MANITDKPFKPGQCERSFLFQLKQREIRTSMAESRLHSKNLIILLKVDMLMLDDTYVKPMQRPNQMF